MKIMIDGLPETQAIEGVKSAIEAGLEVVPFSLTHSDDEEVKIGNYGQKSVFVLVNQAEREERIHDVLKFFGPFISLDLAHPTQTELNYDFYCRNGLYFIGGAPGADIKVAAEKVRASGISAVIAPNMSLHSESLQTVVEFLERKMKESIKGQVYSMNDVLNEPEQFKGSLGMGMRPLNMSGL